MMIRVVNLLIGAVFALALTVLIASLARAQIGPDPYAAPPPPPPPLGWVYTNYTTCPQPISCPVVFVSVGADGLNVRTTPNGYPVVSLVNGTPLVVLDRQGSWTLVAPACELIPTGLWSWTADVPLIRCFVSFARPQFIPEVAPPAPIATPPIRYSGPPAIQVPPGRNNPPLASPRAHPAVPCPDGCEREQ